MGFRDRVAAPHLEHWDQLELALGGGELPAGVDPDDAVQAVFQVAQAKGFLKLEGGSFQLTPLGVAIEEPLTRLASGRMAGWADAVRAVAQTEGHADPNAYFSGLAGGHGADATAPYDAESAAAIARIVSDMQRQTASGSQERILVKTESGRLAGVAWYPDGAGESVSALQFELRVREWQRKDGGRCAYVPTAGMALALFQAADKAGVIRFEADESGAVTPKAVPGEETVLAILLSHSPGARPDDEGLIGLVDRLLS